MSKHTPGPWIIDPPDVIDAQDAGFFGAPEDNEGYHMVATDGWRLTGFIGMANAKLIAAAPELLEALKRIGDPEFRYSSDDDEDTQLSMRIADARAAIAKATGEA